MNTPRPLMLAFVGWFALAVACGTHPSASAVDPDAGTDAGTDAGIAPIAVQGQVIDWQSAPLAGAKVCLIQPATLPCAVSDSQGNYTLELAAWTTGTDMAVSATADGYLGYVGLLHQAAPVAGLGYFTVWLDTLPLRTDAEAAQLMATQAGFTYPAPGKGFLHVFFYGAVDGSTLTLTPAAGTGQGPVYSDASGVPTPALGALEYNEAYFGDLDPGRVEVTIDTPCGSQVSSTFSWADDKPSTVAGVIAAGALTDIRVECE